jgi:PHP family Zn ribbon phosphoesterase
MCGHNNKKERRKMEQKYVSGECMNCESTFEIQYHKELVSADYPQHCPFCGEVIEDITDEYIDEDNDFEDDNWENEY